MAVTIPQEEIAAYCDKWGVRELALFGSALRGDFGEESDVDVLVTFRRETEVGLTDLLDMQQELSRLLGRKVDLVERSAVEHSPNYIRQRHILSSLEPIYVAG